MIIWGKKKTRRRIGSAADYCPICHQSRSFTLTRIGLAGHLYMVAIGEGRLVGYLATCAECGVELAVDVSRYAAVSTDGERDDLRTLVMRTHPALDEMEQRERERVRRIRNGEGSPQERRDAFVQALWLVGQLVERRAEGLKMDFLSWLVAVTAFLFAAVAVSTAAGALAGVASFVVLAALIVFMATGRRRYVNRVVWPLLRKAIVPLRPRSGELTQALNDIRGHGLALGAMVKDRSIEELAQPGH
jgi:hypothetical protein